MKDVEIQPSEQLVDWAAKTIDPSCWDRPWVHLEGISISIVKPKISINCTCNFSEEVVLRRYPCVDKKEKLFIGQCKRCGLVHWTYVSI